jgi:hypothetical protein
MSEPTSPTDKAERLGWFDQQFTTIGWPMLIALTILFTVPMWIFSGLGLLLAKNSTAHRKAKIIFVASSVYMLGCIVLIFALR